MAGKWSSLWSSQVATASGPEGSANAVSGAPAEVGLYGLGFYTLPILKLCRGAGIRVAFVVDDCPEAHPDYPHASICLRSVRQTLSRLRLPVWTNAAFCGRLERGGPLPPLIGSNIVNRMDGSVSSDSYLRGARLVREVSGERCSLLHPVVLAHAVRLPPYRKRLALFGFPGSGNILAKHLIDELWRRLDAPPPLPVVLAGNFAEHYYVSTAVLVRHLLRELRPIGLELTPMQFPAMDLSLALSGGEYAQALNIPCNRHLGSFFHHTHAIPTEHAVEELTRLGALCVAVIRHPCETILSWASKLSRPPTPILDRADLFQRTVLELAEWHRQLIGQEHRILVLRYEDLTGRRRRPLRLVAERMGLSLREREIESLYDRFLDRELQPERTPGHYYCGGHDKWKHYFLPHHVRRMAIAGFDEICRHWGYDLALPSASAPVFARDKGGPSGQRAGVLPLDSLSAINDGLDILEPFPLFIRSNSREVSEAIGAALHGPEFLEHLNAGGLGPASPPWVPPIPWETLLPIFHPEVAEMDSEWPVSVPFERVA